MIRQSTSELRRPNARPRSLLVALFAVLLTATALAGSQAGAASPKVIVLIPKQTGDPFFAFANQGAQEAAGKLGYTIKYIGPTTADASGQVSTIQNVIQTHPVAIAIAGDDPNAVAPALKAAAKQGILVTSFNADVAPDARSFYVEDASADGIAQAIVDDMAKQTNGQGHFLWVSATPTAANQNLWNKLAKAYMAKKYPKMHIDELIYGNDDPSHVLSVVSSYLAGHKSITGIIVDGGGMSGAIKAEQKNGIDPHKVPVAGLCIPSDIRAQMHAGLIKDCVLWSPSNTAYANVYAIDAYLKHKYKENGTLKAGKLGTLVVKNNVVNAGKPVIFTPDNIDQYKF